MKLVRYPKDDEVEQTINRGPFEFRLARILHQFGVASGKDHDAVAPLSVAQDASAEQNLVIVQRILFTVPRQTPFEFVQVVVWRLADDLAVESADPSLVLAHFGRLHQALAAFQIGLPVVDRPENISSRG